MNKNNILTLVSFLLLGGLCIYMILVQDMRTFLQSLRWGLTSGEIQIYSFVIGTILCAIAGIIISLKINEKSSSRITTPFGVFMSIFLLSYWFIPMSGTGSMGASWYNIPVAIRNQYRIACLFTHSSRSWPTAHFEVLKEGESDWEEGPLEGYFDLDIFGYRSRFNRILSASKGKYKEGKSKGKLYPSNRKRLQEMSEYIAKMWAKNNPEDPPVTKVRLSLANHPTGKKHCMAREKWSRPPIEDIPKKYLREVGVFPISSSDAIKTTPSKKSNALQKVPSKVQKNSLKVPIMKKTTESKEDSVVSEPKRKEE